MRVSVSDLPTLYERLRTLLRDLRLTSGRTQAQVAEALGLSRPQYTAIETGGSVLTLGNLFALARVYGISAAQLVEGVEDMPRPRGSRVVLCPKCSRRIVGKPGTVVTCKNKDCPGRVKIKK